MTKLNKMNKGENAMNTKRDNQHRVIIELASVLFLQLYYFVLAGGL
jgi:hypothetical protein